MPIAYFFTQFIEDDRNIYEKFQLPEKQERIDLLEHLLMEYRPSGQQVAKENLKTCIDLLHELGVAYSASQMDEVQASWF